MNRLIKNITLYDKAYIDKRNNYVYHLLLDKSEIMNNSYTYLIMILLGYNTSNDYINEIEFKFLYWDIVFIFNYNIDTDELKLTGKNRNIIPSRHLKAVRQYIDNNKEFIRSFIAMRELIYNINEMREMENEVKSEYILNHIIDRYLEYCNNRKSVT